MVYPETKETTLPPLSQSQDVRNTGPSGSPATPSFLHGSNLTHFLGFSLEIRSHFGSSMSPRTLPQCWDPISTVPCLRSPGHLIDLLASSLHCPKPPSCCCQSGSCARSLLVLSPLPNTFQGALGHSMLSTLDSDVQGLHNFALAFLHYLLVPQEHPLSRPTPSCPPLLTDPAFLVMASIIQLDTSEKYPHPTLVPCS